jgi:hypothetical protein
VIAVDGLAAEAARVDERPKTNLVRAAREQAEADLRDDPVLPDQRHHIGERADGGDLDESRKPLGMSGSQAQGVDELQRHADAREVLVRVRAVQAFRIEHGARPRKDGVGLVVVGDDEVHAVPACPLRCLDPPDAAVHRDHQTHAVGMEPIDRGGLQAVAVAQPFRQEVRDVRAEQLEHASQDDRGGHPIDVVVAMHGDSLPTRDGAEHAIDRGGHVRERERIVEAVHRGSEEAPGRIRIGEPADAEDARGHWRHTQFLDEPAHGAVVAGLRESRADQLSAKPTFPMARHFR